MSFYISTYVSSPLYSSVTIRTLTCISSVGSPQKLANWQPLVNKVWIWVWATKFNQLQRDVCDTSVASHLIIPAMVRWQILSLGSQPTTYSCVATLPHSYHMRGGVSTIHRGSMKLPKAFVHLTVICLLSILWVERIRYFHAPPHWMAKLKCS